VGGAVGGAGAGKPPPPTLGAVHEAAAVPTDGMQDDGDGLQATRGGLVASGGGHLTLVPTWREALEQLGSVEGGEGGLSDPSTAALSEDVDSSAAGRFTLEPTEVDRAAIVQGIASGLLAAAVAGAAAATQGDAAAAAAASTGTEAAAPSGFTALAAGGAVSRAFSEAGQLLKRASERGGSIPVEGGGAAADTETRTDKASYIPTSSAGHLSNEVSATGAQRNPTALTSWLLGAYGSTPGGSSVGMAVREMGPLSASASAPLTFNPGMGWRDVAQQVAAAKQLTPVALSRSPDVASLWLERLSQAILKTPGARAYIADAVTAVFCLSLTRLSAAAWSLSQVAGSRQLLPALPGALQGTVDWGVVRAHAHSLCIEWLLPNATPGALQAPGPTRPPPDSDLGGEQGGTLHHMRHLLPRRGSSASKQQDTGGGMLELMCSEGGASDDEAGEEGVDVEHTARSYICAWRHLTAPPQCVLDSPASLAFAPDLQQQLEGMLLWGGGGGWQAWALRCCAHDDAPNTLKAHAAACRHRAAPPLGPGRGGVGDPHAALTEGALRQQAMVLMRAGLRASV